jgi:hypothetical protein
MGPRNRSHHPPIHYGDSSEDASQYSNLLQARCILFGSKDISCSPSSHILPTLLLDFREPKSYLQPLLNKPVVRLHFDIAPFSLLIRFTVEIRTSKHFLRGHRVELQVNPFLQLYPLR